MKKILIFSTSYFPFVGGAEVAVKEITDRIGDWQFDMITARRDPKLLVFERIGNINVWRVGFGLKTLDKFILPLLGYLKAKKLDQKNNYALIWSIMASQASVAAAFFKKSRPATKLLLTLQEGDEEEHLKRYVLGINFLYRLLIRPWHLLVFKRADYLTAISSYLKERAKKNGVNCPIEIVPNGVDIKLFSREFSGQELDGLKDELNNGSDDKFIVHTGRPVKKNALVDIIKALKFLPENIKFLAVGPVEESLKQLAVKEGVASRVLFIGPVNHREMVKYLKIADVFVRPALSEGLGNSFLEAMAAGVPVVGTRVGGIPNFLQDPSAGSEQATGLFCEARHPKSIAQKVKMILENEQLRQKIISNAKELVVKNYDWDMINKKMKNIFNKLTQSFIV